MKKSQWDQVYSPVPDSFERKLTYTLQNLEALSMARYKVNHKKTLVAMIAALIGVLALGCIAYAAAPLIRDIFGWNVEKVEHYESMTDEQKLEHELSIIENNMRGHTVNASVVFEGIEVSMPAFDFIPKDESDQPQGYLRTRINYSSMPPFDPNFVDFEVRAGDTVYPLHMDDGLNEYRRKGAVAKTADEITADDWYSNTRYSEDGLLTTYMFFEVPEWRIDTSLPMELFAEIGGKQLLLPFTFESEKAHEAATAMAKENVSAMQKYMDEQKSSYTDMAQSASPVGLTRHHDGNVVTLSEMAYTDGHLCFSVSTELASFPKEYSPFSVYDINMLRVDGIEVPWGGGTSSTDWKDELELTVHKKLLNRSEQNLPEQSVLYVHLANDWDKPGAEMIYRYHWESGEVTLPSDEAEEAAWLEEEGKLHQAYLDATVNKTLHFDLSGQQFVYEGEGFQLTVTDISMNSDIIDVTYTYEILSEGKKLYLADYLPENVVRFNGVDASFNGGGERDTKHSIYLLIRDNMMEISEENTLSITTTAFVFDEKRTEISSTAIPMNFVLNKNTATLVTDAPSR